MTTCNVCGKKKKQINTINRGGNCNWFVQACNECISNYHWSDLICDIRHFDHSARVSAVRKAKKKWGLPQGRYRGYVAELLDPNYDTSFTATTDITLVGPCGNRAISGEEFLDLITKCEDEDKIIGDPMAHSNW